MNLAAKQRKIDRARREMARAIVEAQNPATLQEAKRFAQAWIESAAQSECNAAYWRARAIAAERKASAL